MEIDTAAHETALRRIGVASDKLRGAGVQQLLQPLDLGRGKHRAHIGFGHHFFALFGNRLAQARRRHRVASVGAVGLAPVPRDRRSRGDIHWSWAGP